MGGYAVVMLIKSRILGTIPGFPGYRTPLSCPPSVRVESENIMSDCQSF
jgi:hypothetical protein